MTLFHQHLADGVALADDIDAGGCALQSGEAASVDAIDFRGSAVLLGRHALHTREGFFEEGEGDGAVGIFCKSRTARL